MAYTMTEVLALEELTPREYIDYISGDDDILKKKRITFPHCDSYVLHSPGTCQYCDEQPTWQNARLTWKINFTDRVYENFSPCPSIKRRPKEVIERWPGNRASAHTETDSKSVEGTCPKCGHSGEWINLALVCPTHGRFAG